MGLQMESVIKDGGKLEIKNNTLYISGSISSQNPGEFLDPFFTRLHEKIVAGKIKEMIIDIRELSYLNSTGIKSFVNWIFLIEELSEDIRYKILIIYSSKYQWQKISINSIFYLSPGLVVQKEG